MPLPVGGGNLVADQLVDGLGVGDAQQRLGEAHQRHAFLRGQGVFVQEGVEPALPIRFRRTAARRAGARLCLCGRAPRPAVRRRRAMRASASVSSRRCQSRIAARSGVSIGGGSRKTQSIGEELVRTQRVAKPGTRTAAASRRSHQRQSSATWSTLCSRGKRSCGFLLYGCVSMWQAGVCYVDRDVRSRPRWPAWQHLWEIYGAVCASDDRWFTTTTSSS